MKIVTVVGARPQFIKLAPVSRVLRKKFDEILVNTGQHYDYNMSGVFFEELNIPKPDYDLGVGSASHGKQTGQMLDKIEEVLLKEKPDFLLVYGDTNSTVAGALAASKLHIPVIHIEAGLRSFNKKMPEEINRVMTDHVSSLLFAPTDTAVKNLQAENIVNGVYNVGDVMYDAVLFNSKVAEEQVNLSHFGVEPKSYHLATIHRAENTDDKERMASIFEAFGRLGEIIVLPLHPRTKSKLSAYGLDALLSLSNLKIIEPLSYLEMLMFEQNAKTIITDSGGVQKEAYFMNVPCFTLRNETEWVETVQSGWNTLLDPQRQDLSTVISHTRFPVEQPDYFGNGQAAEKIIKIIEEHKK